MNQEQLESGRKELEALLNSETSATEMHRTKVIESWYRDIIFDRIIVVRKGKVTHQPTRKKPRKVTYQSIRKNLQKARRLIYVRAHEPHIIGKGTHQLVIDVGNGLVAKVTYEGKWVFYEDDTEIIPVGRTSFSYMRETRDALLEMGLDVPPMNFYRIDWSGKGVVDSPDAHHSSYGVLERRLRTPEEEWLAWFTQKISEEGRPPNVYLTLDLRENGRYRVAEYDEEQAKRLPNGNLIVRDFEKQFSVLLGLYQNFEQDEQMNCGKPFLMYEPHKENTPEEAIRKMFLLQVPVDDKENGKLAVGDIDHVYVFK